MMNDQTERSLALQRMYLKDCSVECPNSPLALEAVGETQFKIDLNVGSSHIAENQYESVLTMKTTASLGDKTLFLVEIKYGCVFQAIGFNEAELERIIQIWAPTQMFPFVRETIASLSTSAGFPQLLLPAVNFEQYYEMRKNPPEEGSHSVQ